MRMSCSRATAGEFAGRLALQPTNSSDALIMLAIYGNEHICRGSQPESPHKPLLNLVNSVHIGAGASLFISAARTLASAGGRTRSFDPARDMDELVAACIDLAQVSLVIIDPIVAVAKGDSHKNAETRRDLQPLVALAEQTRAAVLGVHHLTKGSEGADPVDRVSGSLAFGAGPRMVMLSALGSKTAGEPRGVLMRAKNNIGPSHGGFEFAGETRPLTDHPSIAAQRILWGAYVNEPARDILAGLEGKAGPGTRKATSFLHDALRCGPRMAAEVIAEGEAAGLGERSLQRALKAVGGSSEKLSFGAGWVWELPERES
jgi:putative DNA primase/helicase